MIKKLSFCFYTFDVVVKSPYLFKKSEMQWFFYAFTTCYQIAGWHSLYTLYHSKAQWMILKGLTVGGLTVYCGDAFTTWYHIVGWHRTPIIKNQWMLLNGQTVGGLTL